MITEITDGKLFVQINSVGAELWRIYDKKGNDFLWNGDSAFWGRRAPTLFPICGGMINDSYIYGSKEYSMPKHGFCREAEFELEVCEKDRAVYLIKSNEERYGYFPFLFEFRIEYTVKDGALEVLYRINNIDGKTMYFSVGSHEAYACPEGIESYRVEFSEKEDLIALDIADNLVQSSRTVIGTGRRSLSMKYDYFSVDALCFRNLHSKKISLIGNGRRIDVEFDGFEYILLWTKPQAPYLCIELNCGIDDYVSHDRIIEHKDGIISLPSSEEFVRKHTMRFSKRDCKK